MLFINLFFFILLNNRVIYSYKFHVAPMQGYTDIHLRYLCRLLSPSSVLWSEMLKPKDLLYNCNEELLLGRGPELDLCSKITSSSLLSSSSSSLSTILSNSECVFQLGDDNIDNLIKCIKRINLYSYTQIDLNCGCPAVENDASYGANLMKNPENVLYLVNKMSETTNLPISIKCRIGVHDIYDNNNIDKYETLRNFVQTVTKDNNIKKIIIHSRSAVLSGLSPSKNRIIPQLHHNFVLKIAEEFNDIDIVINGGFNSIEDVIFYKNKNLNGLMSGRWILNNCLDLYNIDNTLHSNKYYYRNKEITCNTAITYYAEYADKMMSYYNKDQYSSILLPLAMLAESILIKSENEIELARKLGITLLESGLPLLKKAGIDINYDIMYNNNENVNDDEVITGIDKFRKYLVKVIGKKIISKLKSNAVENVS